MTSKKRKTALVLSGGGALGAAHIGVVEILENRDMNSTFIVVSQLDLLLSAYLP